VENGIGEVGVAAGGVLSILVKSRIEPVLPIEQKQGVNLRAQGIIALT
jgi:hypothetical protein